MGNNYKGWAINPPIAVYPWRLWYQEPDGMWANPADFANHRQLLAAQELAIARGYTVKREFLGRPVGC